MWGRQNLKSDKPLVDVNQEGFFHSMGVHQLGQIVMSIGMPKSVICLLQNLSRKI